MDNSEQYAFIIGVAALVSAIPTDARNVPWEDWGPSSTHFYKMARTLQTSLGPFWIPDYQSPVVRQYDIRRTRYTQSMPGHKSSLRSSLPFDLKRLQYDIETHLPYRDVMMENNLYQSYYIVANREWVVGVPTFMVRGFCPHIWNIPV